MTKKAQGLSLNTIIIAILVIIVLVVIVMIFTGRIVLFRQSIEDCESKGGVKSTTPEKQDHACYKIKENNYCCIPIGSNP